jgi:hypothetical protein
MPEKPIPMIKRRWIRIIENMRIYSHETSEFQIGSNMSEILEYSYI